MTLPTKQEYEKALEIKKKYEKRQADLKFIKMWLSEELVNFSQIKFNVNKKSKTVIFAGILNGELKLGVAKVSPNDKFNEDIGKLIAVLKAQGRKIDKVEKYIESVPSPIHITASEIADLAIRVPQIKYGVARL